MILNGEVVYHKSKDNVRCIKCIHDTSVPGIKFDEEGVCSFCNFYDEMDRYYPIGTAGQQELTKKLDRIRKGGQGKKYDCVVGISGGRDSIYLLHKVVVDWKLRALAVHFNDGFDNPTAGENMVNTCKKLGVELRTITSDWREAKDLKIAFLKASTPDLNQGTDLGIASSLFGVAHKEGLKHILFGQSFRTEGIKPVLWTYFDGDYLRAVQKKFGKVSLRKWQADDPGFNLGIKEMVYYNLVKGIKIFAPFYHYPYNRKEAEEIIKREYDWVYPGAHYFDDLYWALITYVHRVKFNIDLRLNSYSFLIRSGQMSRDEAITLTANPYLMEDPKVIYLCVKRLGLTMNDFDEFMKTEPKTFLEYPNSYKIIRVFKWPIWLLTEIGYLPKSVYFKYFKCGLD
jgi:hypothetical protein